MARKKTISAWLKTLAEPYRKQALKYPSIETLKSKEPNLQSALSGAFVWSNTVEGFYYWNELWLASEVKIETE